MYTLFQVLLYILKLVLETVTFLNFTSWPVLIISCQHLSWCPSNASPGSKSSLLLTSSPYQQFRHVSVPFYLTDFSPSTHKSPCSPQRPQDNFPSWHTFPYESYTLCPFSTSYRPLLINVFFSRCSRSIVSDLSSTSSIVSPHFAPRSSGVLVASTLLP